MRTYFREVLIDMGQDEGYTRFVTGRYAVVEVDAGEMVLELSLADLDFLKELHVSLEGDGREDESEWSELYQAV